MSDLIKLVKTYRLTRGLVQRLELADRILPLIERGIWSFVLSPPPAPMPKDAMQDALKSIFINLDQFRGHTHSEFFGWCWRITRNKVNNQISKHLSDRLQPLPDDDFLESVESSISKAELSPGDRLDLEYALNLLRRSKPECDEYLRNHFIVGLNYAELADNRETTPGAVRMRIRRCLDEARKLME